MQGRDSGNDNFLQEIVDNMGDAMNNLGYMDQDYILEQQTNQPDLMDLLL